MVRGHIDALLSCGFIEGWALDSRALAAPLPVAVVNEAHGVVASGVANLFRDDLVDAGCGVGWCAFRLRVEGPERFSGAPLALLDLKSKTVIARYESVGYFDAPEPEFDSVAQLIGADPTMIRSVDELRGCESLFRAFILRAGVDAFVRAAYVYVLSRPADADGLAHYGRQLRAGAMTPFRLLRALAESDEFRARPRLLVAPNSAAFPLGSD